MNTTQTQTSSSIFSSRVKVVNVNFIFTFNLLYYAVVLVGYITHTNSCHQTIFKRLIEGFFLITKCVCVCVCVGGWGGGGGVL